MKRISKGTLWLILFLSSIAIWIVIGLTYVPWARITDVRHPIMAVNAVYTFVTLAGYITTNAPPNPFE